MNCPLEQHFPQQLLLFMTVNMFNTMALAQYKFPRHDMINYMQNCKYISYCFCINEVCMYFVTKLVFSICELICNNDSYWPMWSCDHLEKGCGVVFMRDVSGQSIG